MWEKLFPFWEIFFPFWEKLFPVQQALKSRKRLLFAIFADN
jgi:hypothetical protein